MSHNNKIIDKDPCFEVDAITRAIRNVSSTKTTLMQYDHNSERFSFTLPRYIEGHDMLECNRAEVHYINAGTPGLYEIKDLAADEADESKVNCSWLISQNATRKNGALQFLLRFACILEDGTVEYVWNSGIHNGIIVSAGMNNTEAIIELYADILEQLKTEMVGKKTEFGAIFGDYENNKALAPFASAFGKKTIADGNQATAIGTETHAGGSSTFTGGYQAEAPGENGFSFGENTLAAGKDSVAINKRTQANSQASLAGGFQTIVNAERGTAFGYGNTVDGVNGFAIGEGNNAQGKSSFAGGLGSIIKGLLAFGFGKYVDASGENSAAFNQKASASAKNSFAAGYNTKAAGEASASFNYGSKASGMGAFAVNNAGDASGEHSFAAGIKTLAPGRCQTVIGKYNKADTEKAFIIGGGTAEGSSARKNIMDVDWEGNVEATSLILKSSTPGSNKRFKITVDDSGTLSVVVKA